MKKLIVGLGNPGAEYNKTRHNVGFMVVDKLNDTYGLQTFKHKFTADYLEIAIENHKVLLFKPQTYMNLSGQAVLQVMQFYKIPFKDMIVIHDDIDLAIGKIKVKTNGSNGGHNGLRSIDDSIGKEYQRIRVGISRPISTKDVPSHVLTKFSQDEFVIIENSILAISENIAILLAGDAEKFMNKCALEINKLKKE